MEGQNLWEMECSSYDNPLQEDEVFSFQHELLPLDFWYPESSGINYDLNVTYLMDNLLETPIHSSMDILPGGISAGQAGEFGLPNQEIVPMNSLSIPNQGIPVTSFSNLLTQGMSSSSFPSQEMFGTSFSSFITQGLDSSSFPGQEMSGMGFVSFPPYELNSLSLLSQDMSGTSFSSFPTHDLNSLSFSSQGLSMMDTLSFPTQRLNSLSLPSQELSMMDPLSFPTPEPYLNTLELPSQGLSMMDILSLPTQELYMNTLEFSNQGLSMLDALNFPTQEMASLGFPNQGMFMDTFGLPTQEAFMNTLEFPNPRFPMMDTLSFPAQEMTSLDFSNQGMYMDTLEFSTQTPPVTMAMGNIRDKGKTKMVGSSGCEPSQKELDPTDGNGNGNGGRELNSALGSMLSMEVISQYFHMSIVDAAKALNIGKTLLKRRCRELGFQRWPQRKFKSLQAIIAHLQEFGESSGNRVEENVQETIMRLENEKKQMDETPDLQLEDDTLRLRQTCYKASHKKRKQSDRGP